MKRQFLSVLLSVAMVATSVNLGAVPVMAEETIAGVTDLVTDDGDDNEPGDDLDNDLDEDASESDFDAEIEDDEIIDEAEEETDEDEIEDEEEEPLHYGTIDVSDYIFQSGGLKIMDTSDLAIMHRKDDEKGDGINPEGAYGASWSLDWKNAMDACVSALEKRASSVNISSYRIPTADLQQFWTSLLNYNPQLFYVSGSVRYSYSGGNISSLNFEYESSHTAEDSEKYEQEVERALSLVSDDMTDLEKALVLHDYIAIINEYATTELSSSNERDKVDIYNAYGTLVNHRSVCNGYAVAYLDLLSRLDIPAEYVSSKTMNHGWNLIKLDGEWYHVDITWDDPVNDRIGRVRHVNFLRSDDGIGETNHRGWDCAEKLQATDTYYDEGMYWTDSDAQIFIDGDYSYYLETNGNIKKRNNTNGVAATLAQITDKWMTSDGSAYWRGIYSGLYYEDGVICYNTPTKVYSFNVSDSSDKSMIYEYTRGDGYIYGSTIKNGKIHMEIMEDPNNDGTVVTASAGSAFAEKVNVYFNAVGGEVSTTSKKYVVGNTYGILPTPSKTGYEFKGWYTSKTGGTRISKDDTVTSDSSTLYAQWTPMEYRVSFDANGGSVDKTYMMVTYDTTYGTLPTPTREGYEFGGWYTSRNRVEGEQIRSSSYVDITGEQTLYADWNPKTYTVRFNANGGTVSKTNVSITYDAVYGALPVPTRTGYSFAGWYTDATLGTRVDNDTVMTTASEHTLYAHWNANSYTVSFALNDGTSNIDTSRSVSYNSAYGTLPNTSRPGYELVGWYTSATSGTKITETTIFKQTANQTLYAHWNPKSLTVSYDANGGTVGSTTKAVTYGKAYGTLAAPSYRGYIFDGWYTDAVLGTKVDATTIVTAVSSHTLYAHWSPKPIKVTYNTNGGVIDQGSSVSNLHFGEAYGAMPEVTRAGYTFEGWYTQQNGGEKVSSTTTITSVEDVNLYAHWNPIKYMVSFDPAGGSFLGTTKEVAFGSFYGTLEDPVKEGYLFNGWYTEPDNGTRITSASTVSIAGNHTLYAHWSGAEFNITYDANGGSVTPTTKKVVYDQPYGALATPTRAGYDFDGWYTERIAGFSVTSEKIVNDLVIRTIYAHWIPKTYVVTFNENGGTLLGEPTKTVSYNSAYGVLGDAQKAGYALEGWYTAASGGTKITEDTLYKQTANQTLYAHWKERTYTISYDALGGTFTGSSSKELAYGGAYGTLPTATRTGYKFDGWYTEPDGGVKLSSTSKLTEADNQTIYAHWIALSYKLTFNGNKGTLGGTATKNIVYDQPYGELIGATRVGFSFDGWYTDAIGGEKITDTTIVKASSNITLYAHWLGSPYNVTFDATEGELVGDGSKVVNYEGSYGTLPAATRFGCDFDGWYTAIEGGTKITEASTVKITGDQILYARWVPAVVELTFDPCLDGVDNQTINATFGNGFGPLPVVIKEGYDFDGWFTQAVGGVRVNAETEVDFVDARTYYGHWTQCRVATPTGTVDSGVVDFGQMLNLNTRTSGAEIYYTDDGSDVLVAGNVKEDAILFSDPIELVSDVTINAVAIKEGYLSSEQLSLTYTVTPSAYAGWGEVVPEDREGYADYTELPDGIWVGGFVDEFVYTGKAITQDSLRVYDKNRLLEATTDYTIKYSNNQKVSTDKTKASVTITGKGVYSGNVVKTFNIIPIDITGISVPDVRLAYNKSVQKGVPVVKYTGREGTVTLKANTDYTVFYPGIDSKKPGYDPNAFKAASDSPYIIEITGKGNYSGTIYVNQYIKEGTSIAKATVTVMAQPYTGSAITSVSSDWITVKNGKEILTFGQDYTVRFANGIGARAAGAYDIIVEGCGDYSGSKQAVFNITGKVITKAKVNGFVATKQYLGEAISQNGVTLQLGTDPVLVEGEDYIAEYTNNINLGTATVVYTGINGCTGTIKKTFKIAAYNIQKNEAGKFSATLGSTAALFKKSGATVPVTVKFGDRVLKEGIDYTVAYSNNTAVNDGTGTKKPTVTIKGKGLFTGSYTAPSLNYVIDRADISTANITVPDVVYVSNKATNCKPAVSITDDKGKKLAAGTDYEKTISYRYENDTLVKQVSGKTQVSVPRHAGEDVNAKDIIPLGTELYAVITGKGNYSGTINKRFRCVGADLSKASVTVNPKSYIYTGAPIRLTKANITVKVGKEIVSPANYIISSYENNVAKGTAKVTITGINYYGGSKTATYTIAVRKIN